MRRTLQTVLGIVIVLLLIGGPVAFAYHQQAQLRNFRIVEEGVLYRSGQPRLDGLRRAIHDYGIRTVVSLGHSGDVAPSTLDREEEAFCRKEELNYVRIPPRHWQLDRGGTAPVDKGVSKFLDVVKNPANHPVLIHCFAGIHRTGGYCAVYRMECDRWGNARAIAEAKACGYDSFDKEMDIRGYLEKYRPGRLQKAELILPEE